MIEVIIEEPEVELVEKIKITREKNKKVVEEMKKERAKESRGDE